MDEPQTPPEPQSSPDPESPLEAESSAEPEAQAEPEAMPALTQTVVDEALLTFAREGVEAPAPHEPPPWITVAGRARVGLWRSGVMLGRAEAADTDLATAVRQAAAAAAAAVDGDIPPDDKYNATLLDVEVVTMTQFIRPAGLSGLMHATQAGIDGLVLREGDRAAGGWPADALSSGRTNARWAKGLLREVRPPGTRLPPSVAVLRFRTREVVGMLWPPSDRTVGVAAMQGGTRVVWPQAVGQQDLVRAAGRAGMWLVRHQREDGLFRYLFQHPTQSWSPDDSLVRQAGCAWAMARLARRLPDAGFAAPTKRAIEGLEQGSVKRGGPGNLAYMQVGDDPPRLGAIPLFLLAADEWDRHSPIDESTRERLAATLLAVQSPEGAFGVDARGLTLEGSETYYAGQIALALARRFEVTGRQRMAEAGLAAVRYYRQWWDDGNRDLSFVTWMLQACEAWYRLRYDDEARDFGFEMADWALQFQQPDDVNLLWGGAFESTPGIGTAAYTEGIVRAVAIAEQAGDAERVERYSQSVRGAMRFLMQLCVEDPDLAFTGGPEQRGAVRSSLRRRNLRCDNAQHFIMAALGAVEVVYTDEPSE
ncbi:MAG: hypothetical protein F4Y94_12205 [Chloroflexi bacterium]|nr:hypothetical protein [Chloroflexota bacterium]